ncbi:hypothetical protein SMJ63A_10067 [Stenotrophomonas geniculata]
MDLHHQHIGRPAARLKEKAPSLRRGLLKLAERTGLEPATSGVTGQHSNQLNYRSALKLCRRPVYPKTP